MKTKVLVAGGMRNSYNTFSSAELYDPTARNWTNADDMSIPCFFNSVLIFQREKKWYPNSRKSK